jgi:hypothetical protein
LLTPGPQLQTHRVIRTGLLVLLLAVVAGLIARTVWAIVKGQICLPE